MVRSQPVRYWCEWALLDTQRDVRAATAAVLIEVARGRITAISSGDPAPAGAHHLPGLTIPGLANAHSHAFHRALRGRTADSAPGTGTNFWTWRERMYQVAERLDPDSYYRLARAVYAEMALAGITAVGEFHYLHHGPGGTPYSDPNAMSAALVAAASDAGIRITLLDTLYLSGGLAAAGTHQPLAGPQRRFGDAGVDAWAERLDAFTPQGAHARVGAAVHSVRAVPAEDIRRFADAYDRADRPWEAAHIHLSEQPAENTACVAAYGRTPSRLLHDTGFLALRPTLVHATHLSDTDVDLLRASRACVCLCPTTERDLADGLPRLADLGQRITPALGSDGHSTIDLFEEARAAEMHERLRTGRRATLPAHWLLEALHGFGHGESLGWHDAGWFGVGMRADLVTLNLDSVGLAGFDPALATDFVVFAAAAADVRGVVVDGRQVVSDGSHLGVPDTARVLDTAIKEIFP